MTTFPQRGASRSAVVTGCSRGIGRAIVKRLAAEGYRVIVNDIERQRAELEGLQAEVAGEGGRCDLVAADVGEPDQVQALADEALARCGTVDVLVNNAGVLSVHRVEDIAPDEWDRMYRVNAKGTFMMCQAFLPHFRQRRAGRIVNIASIGGKRGGIGQAHYCSSKAAVISFTHILAMEVGGDGITVNAVCPGIIDTEMGRNNYRDVESYKKVIETTTLSRLGYPDDVSGSVAFFASDDAAFITGQSLNVCGGITFH